MSDARRIDRAERGAGFDRSLAERMVRAGQAAARAAGTGRTGVKSADPVDVVGAADHAAEAAMLALVPEGDAVLTEESGAHGEARRTWVLDPVDGTANLQAGRGGLWCCAAALVEDGLTVASAVAHGDTTWSAEHRAVVPPLGPWRARSLAEATVACFLPRQLGEPSRVGGIAGAAGALLAFGCGSIELAWVAEGRLDAWLQPQPALWDWLPGMLLVTAAGGAIAMTDDGWCIAGAPPVVAELEGRAPWRA